MKNFWTEQIELKRKNKYMSNVLKKENMSNDARVNLLVENQGLFNNQFSSNDWESNIYGRVALKTVEKLYDPANFLALNLISMQPMSGPTGAVKYLRFRYTKPKDSSNPDGSAMVIRSLETNYDQDVNHKETGYDLPEIRLVEEQEECAAKTRKMKVEFPLLRANSESITEGFKHYYGDFYLTKDFSDNYPETKEFMEEEMTSYMTSKLTDEIHAEILTDLMNNAGTVAAWDAASSIGNTFREKYEDLYVKIVEISGIIHRKTLRGGVNWIVASPEITEIFTSATYNGLTSKNPNNSELFYHGTVNSKWKLFSSKSMKRDTVVLGYKGEINHDAGYFYNPYIPLTACPKMPDPETKMFTTGTLSRYSKKLLREGAKFYARLKIQNL